MALAQEIEQASRQVSTDAFSLTIGELINLYRDGDIVIDPDFQRLFRWDIERKSRLIESILVRIPLPPIFVFELQTSRWEVIDGLQRLSTILEFTGELRDPDTRERILPRGLVGTQYLPSLRGAFWSAELKTAQLAADTQRKIAAPDSWLDNTSYYHEFDGDVQRAIKRTKIGIQLLEKKSDPQSKYDLFQRLNSGGMTANDQELRNCAIVMVNTEFYNQMKDFVASQSFRELIPLGARSIEKSNDLDNLSKIIAFSFHEYRLGTDIEEYVTHSMVELASAGKAKRDEIFATLKEGIDLLISSCGHNALRPFRDGRFVGKIGRTSIEIILVGLLRNLETIKHKSNPPEFIRDRIISFWASNDAKKYSAAGIAGTDRVQYTVPLGVKLFSDDS